MPIEANRIADVSLANHFQATETNAPVNGQIKVHKNVYDVTFANGRVSAKFLTGNAFTNFFRSKTLGRFTRNLQSQYTVWLDQQRRIEEEKAFELTKTLGFKDNPDAAKVQTVADEFTAILNETNPPGKELFLGRLGEIRTLASLRNQMTANPSPAECNKLLSKAGIATHLDDHTKGWTDKAKKGYLINTIDSIIGGFLAAAEKMKDKKTEIVEFLREFRGTCLEAKNDNIQDWLSVGAGIAKVSKSVKTDNLAYSVTLEFAAIADEVNAPYLEQAAKACEAEVRAACAKKGITDEAEIKRRIDSKAALLVMDKEDEIKPILREKLERYGKFVAYEALVGAKRPVTQVEKNAETGKWVVTTLVDGKGEPVLKPVSAGDIDKNFSQFVEMFMEDAFAMGNVEKRTATAEPVFATREDLRAEGVLATATRFQTGEGDVAELARLVKAEFAYDPGISDEEFQEQVKSSLSKLMTAKRNNPDESKEFFKRFVDNCADASYFDAKSDLERLVDLLARRTEMTVDRKKALLARIPSAAPRCAMMMKNAYEKMNFKVFPAKATDYIEMALEKAVNLIFKDDADPQVKAKANKLVNGLMPTGILFTDHPTYDLAHRPGGRDEVKLHDGIKLLRWGVRTFSGGRDDYYIKHLNG
jgi:hypothetical protein